MLDDKAGGPRTLALFPEDRLDDDEGPDLPEGAILCLEPVLGESGEVMAYGVVDENGVVAARLPAFAVTVTET
jgi:hypothetical protein